MELLVYFVFVLLIYASIKCNNNQNVYLVIYQCYIFFLLSRQFNKTF